MIETLKKITGRSAIEIRFRAYQEVSAFFERLGFGPKYFKSSVTALTEAVKDPKSSRTASAALEHFRGRKDVPFYVVFQDKESTVFECSRRFPEETQVVVASAERILTGRFDLLGYKDLYFGGAIPRWNLDPVNGATIPMHHWSILDRRELESAADRKVVWELNRHQYFITLGQAYWLTSDERYAEHFTKTLENWIAENEPKMGINWQSSLEVSFRSISWIWAFHFFRDSPHLDAVTFARMLKILCVSGRHIATYLSTYSSPNTHLTGEALGLYHLGCFLPEFEEAQRWKSLGCEILNDALNFQIRDDGVYCEQASHYHRYTTDFYTTFLILRNLDGDFVDAKHQAKLNQLYDYLLYLVMPNGEIPLLGDDDGGRLHFISSSRYSDIRPTLAMGAALLKRGDLKCVAGEACPELLWFLGADGLRDYDGLETARPSNLSKTFAKSGYYCARSSWSDRADYLLVDCGPHGFLNGGHAHADALSFVLALGGNPIFIDSGTYKYASDAVSRDLFRSTQSHNCLTVNNESSSIPAGPWSWNSMASCSTVEWHADENGVMLRGRHDGFERLNVKYERSIELKFGRQMVVTDHVSSSSKNVYQVHFILSPEWWAELNGETVIIRPRAVGNQIVTIRTRMQESNYVVNSEWVIIPWEVSPQYGSKIESTKLILSLEATGDLRIVSEISIERPVSQNL